VPAPSEIILAFSVINRIAFFVSSMRRPHRLKILFAARRIQRRRLVLGVINAAFAIDLLGMKRFDPFNILYGYTSYHFEI
jgi:hypothetical protein